MKMTILSTPRRLVNVIAPIALALCLLSLAGLSSTVVQAARQPTGRVVVHSGSSTANLIAANTYFVNSTLDLPDADPGDGKCAAANGACTLRAAIMQANFTAGPDTI